MNKSITLTNIFGQLIITEIQPEPLILTVVGLLHNDEAGAASVIQERFREFGQRALEGRFDLTESREQLREWGLIE